MGGELARRVQEYIKSQDWNYSYTDTEFQIAFELENQLDECDMEIQIQSFGNDRYGIHTKTICPLSVPAEMEDRVIELITRANYGMVDGYFSYISPEDDSEEGTVEYSSWLYCSDSVPSLRDIESSVDFPVQIMNEYGDALFNVIKRNANPEEEIRRVEE